MEETNNKKSDLKEAKAKKSEKTNKENIKEQEKQQVLYGRLLLINKGNK